MKNFQYALHGFVTALRTEKNLRFQLASAIVVTAAGIFFKIDVLEWMVVVLCIVFVITAELMNTALEKLCDVVTRDHHPQIKIIKDIAAAGVLIASAGAAIAGLIIFTPKIITLLHL